MVQIFKKTLYSKSSKIGLYSVSVFEYFCLNLVDFNYPNYLENIRSNNI